MRRDEVIRSSRDFEYGSWMRALDPPGWNNSAGTYHFRGEGSNTGFNGERGQKGGQYRKDQLWRLRKDHVIPPQKQTV